MGPGSGFGFWLHCLGQRGLGQTSCLCLSVLLCKTGIIKVPPRTAAVSSVPFTCCVPSRPAHNELPPSPKGCCELTLLQAVNDPEQPPTVRSSQPRLGRCLDPGNDILRVDCQFRDS